MRARTAAILVFLLASFATIPLVAPVAHARSVTFAQDTTSGEDESQGSESGNQGGGSGQSDPDAESGAGKGEQEEGTSTEEEGPPWTYQMARIGLVLLLFMAVGLGFLYYRMIVSRQRGVA